MKTYSQALGAGGIAILPGGFQFLLLESTSDVDVQFYGPFRKKLELAEGMEEGLSVRFPEGFASVEITSPAAQTIKVGISSMANAEYGKLPDLTIESPAGFYDVADVTLTNGVSTILCGVNTHRRKVLVTSLETNTNEIRIGASTVTASRGTPLQPGESYEIETQGIIYGFVGVASQKISVSYTQG